MSFTRATARSLIGTRVNSRRFITLLYAVLLGGLGVTAGVFYFNARAEFNQLKEVEAATRKRLAEKEAQLAEQKTILARLQTDPAFVEKILRQRLHYAKPGEVIFRFED